MSSQPGCNRRIGRNLATWRRHHDYTQAQVAAVLLVFRETIAQIEAGRRRLTLAEALVLDTEIGLTLEILTDDAPVGR